jgi:subtilisin family serine protease
MSRLMRIAAGSLLLLLLTAFVGGANAVTESDRTSIEISPGAKLNGVVVKFDESAKVRMRRYRLISETGFELGAVQSTVGSKNIRRLFVRTEAALEQEINQLKSVGRRVIDKNSYYLIDVSDPIEAQQLVENLSKLPVVEYVYADPQAEPAVDIPPTTPDFSSDQGYLYSPPEGIGADFAWSIPGGTGSGVNIVDIEGNWQFDHEDFGSNVGSLLGGSLVPLQDWVNHGTAVTGELCADSNEYGVTGIAFDADINMVSTGGIGVAAAVDIAAANLSAGDIIVIELHTPGPRYNFEQRIDQLGYVPVEYFQANFDAVQMASAKGIVVVAAAGNGVEDLDDPIYENRFDRDYRDSRAILVGAGAPPGGEYGPDRSRLYFSNWGSRVDLQGWGRDVVTTGYGGLFSGGGDVRQYYTETFSGTSSATPIVAGAVACLQGISQEQFGTAYPIEAVASLLISTGSSQPNPVEWIGPRPNLQSAYQLMPAPGLEASPTCVDLAAVGGGVASETVVLINLNQSDAVEYTIAVNDTVEGTANPGWIELSSYGGTIDPGGYEGIVVTLNSATLEDTSYAYKGLIEIDYGAFYNIRVPVFFEVLCNDSSYAYTDSDSSGGPQFDWVDITQIGTRIDPTEFHNQYRPEGSLDDGTSKKIDIGFPFNFYNDVFTHIYAGVNGGLSFVDDEVNVSGYFADLALPNPGIEAALFPFWNDLSIDTAGIGHGSVYYYLSQENDSLVIEYHEVNNYADIADSMVTFEIILTSDNNITFQYLDVGIRDLDYSALIGMSRDEGCRAFEYYSPGGGQPSHYAHDLLRVDLIPQYEPLMQSGDANGSGDIDIDDVVYLVNYIFTSGPPPAPMAAGDCNCSGDVDIDDVVYLVNYIFTGGPAPCKYIP